MPNSNQHDKSNLQHTRQSIDIIDNKIIELLAERSTCVAVIAEIKNQQNLPAYDAEREKYIIDSICKNNPTHYQSTDMTKIFRAILRAGLNQQLLQHADIYADSEE